MQKAESSKQKAAISEQLSVNSESVNREQQAEDQRSENQQSFN